MDYQEILDFHGHSCPGVAIGYRMTCAAMDRLKAARSEDEEVVAIVENDACGVDALQCLTGCTFGKGNLIFHDYGKQVYTLFSRQTGKGVRVSFHGKTVPEEARQDREAYEKYVLEGPLDTMMDLTEVTIETPQMAQRRKSIVCSRCREAVMDTRIRTVDDQSFCIPCAEKG
ncbi:MAG: formylmethanofuran dehydrogenase [Proteobacteria bacterium]|nr:formylmethanofuran dehydrogenase [Pseudomonadota bacterium]